MAEGLPEKFTNPWLSKGSSHILKSNSPKTPPPNEVSIPPTFPNSDIKGYQEYNIRFHAAERDLSVEVIQDKLNNYLSSVSDDLSIILGKEDKRTDSSVMLKYKTVGLVNECNNCYQNSVIQVFIIFFTLFFSACYITPLFLSYFLKCVLSPKELIFPILLC